LLVLLSFPPRRSSDLVLAPPGDLDGLAGAGELQAADVGGLQGAGLGAAVSPLAGYAAGRDLPPGQRPDLGVQQRLVLLHDRDVIDRKSTRLNSSHGSI